MQNIFTKALRNPFYRTGSLEILLFFAGWGIWWSFFQIWLTTKQGFSGAQVGTIYTFGSAVWFGCSIGTDVCLWFIAG